MAAYATADKTYGIDVAQAGKQHGIDLAVAQRNYDLAVAQEVSTAEADRDAAIDAADQNLASAEASASLGWTSSIVGAETTFTSAAATDQKNLAVALAGLQKTYTINMAGYASTADNADAASLADYWNQLESATSSQYTARATAWSDYVLADFADQATALSTLSTTIGCPWSQYEADLAGAKRDWWSATKTDYLTYVSDTSQKHEDCQTAIGNDYIDITTAITTANDACVTSVATARESRAVAAAGSGESFVQSMAGARGSYLTASAQAGYDLSVNGDQSAHDTAMKTAVEDFRSSATTAKADYRVASATTKKDYANAVHGTGGASATWEAALASAIKDFSTDRANAQADMQVDLANLDAAYATLESQSYATALSNLATTNPSPWSQQAVAEAQAAADRVAEIAAEEAAWRATEANAIRQEEIDEANATEALSNAESTAAATSADTTSNAAFAKANQQATAEQDSNGAAYEGALPTAIGLPSTQVPIGSTSSEGWFANLTIVRVASRTLEEMRSQAAWVWSAIVCGTNAAEHSVTETATGVKIIANQEPYRDMFNGNVSWGVSRGADMTLIMAHALNIPGNIDKAVDIYGTKGLSVSLSVLMSLGHHLPILDLLFKSEELASGQSSRAEDMNEGLSFEGKMERVSAMATEIQMLGWIVGEMPPLTARPVRGAPMTPRGVTKGRGTPTIHETFAPTAGQLSARHPFFRCTGFKNAKPRFIVGDALVQTGDDCIVAASANGLQFLGEITPRQAAALASASRWANRPVTGIAGATRGLHAAEMGRFLRAGGANAAYLEGQSVASVTRLSADLNNAVVAVVRVGSEQHALPILGANTRSILFIETNDGILYTMSRASFGQIFRSEGGQILLIRQ